MKIGDIEGTPEEIKNFMENNGLKIKEFFQVPERRIAVKWFVIPSIITLSSIAILTLSNFPERKANIFVFLIGCAGSLWLAANIQIRFKNIWAAGGVLVACILFLLVALGVLLPSDLPEEARKWKH